MKWVLIGKRHINTDLVQMFWWADGGLNLFIADNDCRHHIEDPEKKNYIKLCQAVGVRPDEEVVNQ